MNKILIFLGLVLLLVNNSYARQSLSSGEFIEKLSNSMVKKGQVMIFYVEQNTLTLKTDRQKIIWIDPFLSRKGIPPSRFFHGEERVNPEKVPADYVFCTHAHLDHTHLATVEIMNRVNPKAIFVGPEESKSIFIEAKIPEKRIKVIKLNDEMSFPGFNVKAVYGEPTDRERITHLGYIFKIGKIKIYDSGDTRVGLDKYIDKMQSLIEEKPDVALIIINKGANNLGPEEAAKLASLIECKLFIPTHFNCFVNNSIDPKSVYPYLPKDSKMKYNIMECNSILTLNTYPRDSSLMNLFAKELKTRVSLKNNKWHLNGKITYPGSKAEGLLMNVRMVNSIFEEKNYKVFDENKNLENFISKVPEYIKYGVRAFTICLQGGFPGYEGAVNSAFNPDGSLRESYLKRAEKVIRECDRLGAAVILGCYYQRQDQILRDKNAVKNGIKNVVNWIKKMGFKNVLLEIANEFPHKDFDHDIIGTPEGIAELIKLAHQTYPGLLVSASGMGNGRLADEVSVESDFLLIHFNGTPVEKIPECIEALRKYGKPIVCNEDDKDHETSVKALVASVNNGCSWGLMLNDHNQYYPFRFFGYNDSPLIYNKMKEVTDAK